MKNINVNLKESIYKLIEEVSIIRNKTISDTIDELLSEYFYQSNKKLPEDTNIVFDESKEVWKDIPGYEGLYQASNYGRIATLRYGFKIRALVRNTSGYIQCAFRINNKIKTFLVHILVANTFNDKCINCTQVDHINNIKSDNRSSNLQWVSKSDNIKYNYSRGITSIEKQGAKGKKIEVFDLQNNSLGVFESVTIAAKYFDTWAGNLSSTSNPYSKSKTTFSKSKQIRIKAKFI